MGREVSGEGRRDIIPEEGSRDTAEAEATHDLDFREMNVQSMFSFGVLATMDGFGFLIQQGNQPYLLNLRGFLNPNKWCG